MIKTGKRKFVSIIVVLAMVMGLIPMGAITAFAATSVTDGTTGTKVTGGTTNTVVRGTASQAVENQTASNITIKESSDKTSWGSADVAMTVDLPANVAFSKKPTVKLNGTVISTSMANANTLTFTINGDNDVRDEIVLSDVKLDVKDVSGSTIAVSATDPADAGTISGVDIAKVKDGLIVSAAAASSTELENDANNQDTAEITLAESKVAALEEDDTFSIVLGDGYTFYAPPVISTITAGNIALVSSIASLSSDRKTATWQVKTTSTSASTMKVTPALNVASTVAAGSDVEVTFSTSNTDAAAAPSPLKVGEISTGDDLSITANSAPTISKSPNQATGDVTIQESKAEVLEADEKTVVLEIETAGVTFASTPQATPSGGLTLLDSSNEAKTTAQPGSLNTGLTTATWKIGDQSTSSSGGSIVISGIAVNVSSSAPTGALKMKLSGTAGASKTITVANISSAATVTVTASGNPAIKINTAGQAAGDITIKETDKEAIAVGTNATIANNSYGILLKIFGITSDNEVLFSEMPTVSVTSGDITLGTPVVAGVTPTGVAIMIPVTAKSTKASTIVVSGIKYDVSAKAVAGSVQVIVSNNGTRLATVANATISTTGQTFSDVSATFWATTYINKVSTKGIMNGYTDGTFRPNNPITRAEFAKVVVEGAGLTLVNPATPSFSDVPTSHWAYKYIETAKAAGIIGGYTDGTFRPSANVTRAEISKMIVEGGKIAINESGAGFSDTAGNWAEKYIKTVANKGIASGYPDGTFKPSNNATRAEASKMVAVWLGL